MSKPPPVYKIIIIIITRSRRTIPSTAPLSPKSPRSLAPSVTTPSFGSGIHILSFTFQHSVPALSPQPLFTSQTRLRSLPHLTLAARRLFSIYVASVAHWNPLRLVNRSAYVNATPLASRFSHLSLHEVSPMSAVCAVAPIALVDATRVAPWNYQFVGRLTTVIFLQIFRPLCPRV